MITIKVGCKVMLRRNIDVSKGLYNGTIGTIVSVKTNDLNIIKHLSIRLQAGLEYDIEQLEYQFIATDQIFVMELPIIKAKA